MPHLDFREALATPEEKLFSPSATVATGVATAAPDRSTSDIWRGLRLSRSSWANIVFVAIASVGGLVCAFYFFNGGELLRAAASWPSEYLYPRPPLADQIATAAEQPNPVDQLSATSESASSRKTDEGKNLSERNPAPVEFAPFNNPTNNTTGPITPPGVTTVPPPIITIIPPPVPPPPTSLLDQLTNDVNSGVTGTDALVQALYQSATSDHPVAATARTTKDAIKSAKRKVSSTKQKAAATATNRASSAARNLQQTATNQTQMGINTVRPVNQMMSSGGMGGIGSAGAIGGVGAGVGTGAGAGAGTGTGVGGVGGGLGGLG